MARFVGGESKSEGEGESERESKSERHRHHHDTRRVATITVEQPASLRDGD
jgi:hypothetical protein